MTDFAALEKRMTRDVKALHGYLWVPDWRGDPDQLRSNLLEEAEELDAHLEAEGVLLRNVQDLTEEWGEEAWKQGPASALFELLHHTFGLAAATAMQARREYQGAAVHAADVAESVSIGLCSAAGCFPLVEEWEGGAIDAETYCRGLAKALREKGIERAGDFQRLWTAAVDLGRKWDWETTRERRALAARAAIANAAWCAVAGVEIRDRLGAAPKTPYRELPGLLLRVAARL